MIFKKEPDCSYWQYDLLLNCPEISHGSFTRQGGYSKGDFAGLNASFDVGDDPRHVEKNLQIISKYLNISSLVMPYQCHGHNIEIISSFQNNNLKCDALITDQKNLGLMIRHADCQACLFYDPIKKVIANVHAGWRGLQQKILTKTILELKSKYGCYPANILACFSPSLGPEFSEFVHFKKEWPESYWKFQWKPSYFNLWDIADEELKVAGVLSSHIERLSVCTYAEDQKCFSYRRSQKTGRLASVIGFITG